MKGQKLERSQTNSEQFGCRPASAAEEDGASGAEQIAATNLRGCDVLAMKHKDQVSATQAAFKHWRATGFPYADLRDNEIECDFRSLQKSISKMAPTALMKSKSTVGLRLANSFHPQMWSARTYGRKRAPIEYFEDDEWLLKVLQRAPRFWPNERCWSAHAVRSLFRIAGPGRVANFRPTVAAGIIRDLSPPGGIIVDFCAGYGGRQLAAIACDRTYLGTDVSRQQTSGNRRMIEALGHLSSAIASCSDACALDFLGGLERDMADLIFTSPPYYDAEFYCESPRQSYAAFPSYYDWLDNFLGEAVRQSAYVLKDGGRLALVLANTRRAPVADNGLQIVKDVFKNVKVIPFPIRRLPSHNHFESNFRNEMIIVATK